MTQRPIDIALDGLRNRGFATEDLSLKVIYAVEGIVDGMRGESIQILQHLRNYLPTANGDIFPEDVLGKGSVSVGCREANDNVISEKRKKLNRLYWSLAGGLVLLGIELIALWGSWKSLVNYTVSHY